MSSGFLLADALAEALRKPYHQGDLNITVQYLIEGLKIGEYRVMLKRNFDTACWVPPAGKRDSHSIYYGDLMLGRVIERFCRLEELTSLPSGEDFLKSATARLEAAAALKVAKRGKAVAPAAVAPTKSDVLDEQVSWLKANLPADRWQALLDTMVQAVGSYGRHEREHARNTSKDLKQVNRDLRTLGIPFYYFNLFEDARIEHISRSQLKDKFNWLDVEDITPIKDPSALLLRCIQLEGASDTEALDSEEPYGKDAARTLGHVAESVESYYRRACECTTSDQLYPVITEFLREFKEDLPPPPPPEKGKGRGKGTGSGGGGGAEGEGEGGSEEEYSGAGERAGDLSTAAEAAEEGDSFFEDFDDGAEVVGGTDGAGKDAEEKAKKKLKGDKSPPPKGPGNKAQGVPESIEPQASGGRASESFFLTNRPGAMDEAYAKRVENLTGMLMRMFKTHNLPAATENPGKRMSSRHLARGELKFIHKKVFGGKGKRKYSVLYDCSGSMGGRPDREGKLLLLALNNLAKRGFLEGHLVLSGWVDGRPGWLSYALPVKDELILRINPHHSSEGIQDALRDNLKHIKGMDDVFVYTDANICDAPMDKPFFAKQRVWPVGLYVGSEDAAGEMERHFPQNIIRNTIEEVVEAMLIRNRRTVG